MSAVESQRHRKPANISNRISQVHVSLQQYLPASLNSLVLSAYIRESSQFCLWWLKPQCLLTKANQELPYPEQLQSISTVTVPYPQQDGFDAREHLALARRRLLLQVREAVFL